MIIRKFLLLCLLTIISNMGQAQTGLAFGPDNSKSSLVVKGKYLYNLSQKDYKITFKLSIDDTFGYIVRLIDSNKSCISIMHATNTENRGNIFSVSLEGKKEILTIPVEDTGIIYGEWFDVSICYNYSSKLFKIDINNVIYTFPIDTEFNSSGISIVFGSYPTNPEMPSMRIKNLSIEGRGNKKLFFPLNETSGVYAEEISQKMKAFVTDPQWLALCHSSWKKVANISASGFARVVYDQVFGNILVLSQDSIAEVNPHKNFVLTAPYKNKLPFALMHGGALYYNNNRILLYNIGDIYDSVPNIAWLNRRKYAWGHIAHNNLNNRLHHHGVYLDTTNNVGYLFGGFGVQTYSNTLYRFDSISQNFQAVHYSGDTIPPRMFPAIGSSYSVNEILVFGGFGNETGRQELGGRNLYDLYSINLKDKIVKKLWSISCQREYRNNRLRGSLYWLALQHKRK